MHFFSRAFSTFSLDLKDWGTPKLPDITFSSPGKQKQGLKRAGNIFFNTFPIQSINHSALSCADGDSRITARADARWDNQRCRTAASAVSRDGPAMISALAGGGSLACTRSKVAFCCSPGHWSYEGVEEHCGAAGNARNSGDIGSSGIAYGGRARVREKEC